MLALPKTLPKKSQATRVFTLFSDLEADADTDVWAEKKDGKVVFTFSLRYWDKKVFAIIAVYEEHGTPVLEYTYQMNAAYEEWEGKGKTLTGKFPIRELGRKTVFYFDIPGAGETDCVTVTLTDDGRVSLNPDTDHFIDFLPNGIGMWVRQYDEVTIKGFKEGWMRDKRLRGRI